MPRLLLAMLVLLGLPSAASAQWAPHQQSAFTADCISSCRENPNVHQSRKGECGAACGCIVGEANTYMGPADYDFLNANGLEDQTNPMVRRFRNTIAACNRRVFGE